MEVVGARQGEQKENTFSSCQLQKILCSTSSFSDSEVICFSTALTQPNLITLQSTSKCQVDAFSYLIFKIDFVFRGLWTKVLTIF